MAKSTPSRRTGTAGKPRKTGTSRAAAGKNAADGKHLVIVESPAKAKTINRYLGPDYIVQASVGHVRDLPGKAPKGSKQPVPGVDLEHGFEPTYEVLPGKKKVVDDLKRAAKKAADVWFATDLDREGEAIAWHLAQELGIDPTEAKRVIFNAITKKEIELAFATPHPIDVDRVNAQQARRILDRIVGYQVSPLLWRKVARGLSAGRVQSVAVRLIVEREREIKAFVPDEHWRFTGRFALDPEQAQQLSAPWHRFITARNDKGKGPTIKDQNAWLADHSAVKAELVQIGGEKFELHCGAGEERDCENEARRIAELTGLEAINVETTENPEGKGPARWRRSVTGRVAPGVRYSVSSIETKRTTSRPPAPFITSTLQMAASSALGMGAQRTMRIAQQLYEGVELRGEGNVGLITYMRTDSTHLSNEAINDARGYVGVTFGRDYLPEKPNLYVRKESQEAHEAIRPADVARHPDSLRGKLTEEQLKLYRLIWNRFVACQMTSAEWDLTTVLLERADKNTGAVFKASGRVLVFDGFYRVTGVPTGEDQTLPEMREDQRLMPFSIEPDQLFTSPPPRYTEASLVKTLEAEGIGRPSTYASIIQVIQDRRYVEQIDRRFYATDLGEVVTDKLIEVFPRLMDLGYTRQMEEVLDRIAEHKEDWRTKLAEFYGPFAEALEHAHETLTHAKAEIEPARYECPECGARTAYRFGKNGRFLSCTRYPDCDYAAPIDREGRPLLPEQVNVRCPDDGSPMVLRTGRFGKFLASVNYPDVKCVINLDRKERIKYPAPPPLVTDLTCPKCGAALNLRRGARGPWLGCSAFPKCRGRLAWSKVEEPQQKTLLAQFEKHEEANPQVIVRSLDGKPIPEGTPVNELILPGGVAQLNIHPDAASDRSEAA